VNQLQPRRGGTTSTTSQSDPAPFDLATAGDALTLIEEPPAGGTTVRPVEVAPVGDPSVASAPVDTAVEVDTAAQVDMAVPVETDPAAAGAAPVEAEPGRIGPGEVEPGGTTPAETTPAEQEPGETEAAPPAAGDSTKPPIDGDVPVEPAAPLRPTRRSRWPVVLIVLGTLIALLAGGAYLVAFTLTQRYDHALPRANLLDPSARAQPADGGHRAVNGPLNFLLLGSDARIGKPSDGQRSDTIIVLHIPASMDRAYLISIPRDLRVHIPEDPDENFSGSTEKINGAFNYGGGGIGGYQLVSKTITELTGIRFDGAAIIDFTGFKSVVALLGGVNMCIDQETKSIHTHITYLPGCQHLDAYHALDYVRQRELLPDGDYDRQRHQQQFLRAILQEARDQGLERDPLKLDRLIRSVEGSLVVDTNGIPVADLVLALANITPSATVGIRLPSYPEMIGGISYVLPEEQSTTLYQAIVSDRLDAWVTDNPTWVNPF
jgi:LCP family protein required for cell wall assembly